MSESGGQANARKKCGKKGDNLQLLVPKAATLSLEDTRSRSHVIHERVIQIDLKSKKAEQELEMLAKEKAELKKESGRLERLILAHSTFASKKVKKGGKAQVATPFLLCLPLLQLVVFRHSPSLHSTPANNKLFLAGANREKGTGEERL